jgi:hypothetical protein
MRRAGPDTIDKTKLLDLLQAQKLPRIDQVQFARAQRDQIIQTIAYGPNWLLIWQQGTIIPIIKRPGPLRNGSEIALFALTLLGKRRGNGFSC